MSDKLLELVALVKRMREAQLIARTTCGHSTNFQRVVCDEFEVQCDRWLSEWDAHEAVRGETQGTKQ